MDLIEKFLREVPRDSDGFEDLEAFWNDAEKINFPLPKRVRTKLVDAVNLDINRLRHHQLSRSARHATTLPSDDSEAEFDYDTSSSISVEIEEFLSEDEPALDHEKDDDNEEQGHAESAASNLNSSFKSIQLSPEASAQVSLPLTEASKAKVATPASVHIEEEVSKESVSPSGLDMSVPQYSFTTARGDKSSLISDQSMERGRESIETTTSTRSLRSRASLKTPARMDDAVKETPVPKTNLPSSIKKNGRASVGDRRVSFNASIDLSPPEPSLSGMNDASTVKEDQSYDLSSRASDLISSAGTTTPSIKKTPSPASQKTFSSKVVESILDDSTQLSINSSPSKTPSSPIKSPLASNEKSKSNISIKSSNKGSPNKSQQWDEESEKEEEKSSVTNISKSKQSASKSAVSSPPTNEKSSRNSSRAASSSKKSTRSTEEVEDEESELEESDAQLSTSKASKLSRSFESTRSSSSKASSSKSSVKDITSPSKSSFDDLPPVDFDGYDDQPAANLEEDDEGDISRISAAKSTTSTPHFSEKGGDLSSVKQTPMSAASSAKKLATPGTAYSEAITTPGSNEFPRGRRFTDESFHLNDSSVLRDEEGDSDRSTDKEELDASAFSPSRAGGKDKKGKGKKGGQKTSSEADTANTDFELSESFIDKSFLKTISPTNQKYAGKEILAQTKQLKKQEKKKQKEAEIRHKKRKGISVSDEEEQFHSDDDDEDYDDDEEADELGLRRSRRATKGRRFAFWKGERPIYQEGTVVAITTVDPTPKKKKRADVKSRDNKRKRSSSLEESTEESEEEGNLRLVSKKKPKTTTAEEEAPLPPVELPKKYQYLPAAKADAFQIYDNLYEQINKESVVCSRAALPPPQPLPCSDSRPPGNKRVGAARHLFHVAERPGSMPGWFAGFMDLPPLAIKDPENVGPLAQIFFVSECQPESLEFALANPEDDDWDDKTAQRVILSPGDSFYVPPGNMYRLENHSKVKLCKINWVIIKPMQELEAIGGSSVSNVTQVRR